ncbi:MAG: CRISPR system precrRNA processing endoribonuclease RAMP protein Cas6 [Ardenticatenaceae bacterium]
MSTNLYAIIMHLHPIEPVTMPAMLGTQVHGAFLGMIREHNPALADWLHADQGMGQPFGVSLLTPWQVLRKKGWRVKPTDTLKLRVTLVGRPLYEAFMAYFLNGKFLLRIGRLTTLVTHLEVSGEKEELAGHATMEGLLDEAKPQTEQRLRFVMPTTWKTGGKHKYFALLPEPLPIFQKLSRKWGQWAPPTLRFDHVPLLDGLRSEQVLVAGYRLRTVHWNTKKPPSQGFIGSISYEIQGDSDFQRTIDLLCRFSFFAGVGNSSGRGLGVVVPEQKKVA